MFPPSCLFPLIRVVVFPAFLLLIPFLWFIVFPVFPVVFSCLFPSSFLSFRFPYAFADCHDFWPDFFWEPYVREAAGSSLMTGSSHSKVPTYYLFLKSSPIVFFVRAFVFQFRSTIVPSHFSSMVFSSRSRCMISSLLSSVLIPVRVGTFLFFFVALQKGPSVHAPSASARSVWAY